MSQTMTTRRRRQFRLKPSTVLSLGLVLVVLFALAIYYRPPKPLIPSVDRYAALTMQAASAPTVLDLKVDDMTHVTFQRGDVAFSLERIDGEWFVVSPFRDRADDRAVALLVGDLAGIAFDEHVEEPEGAAAYGFDAPAISATFTDRSGQPHSMLISQPEGAVEWYIQTSDADNPYLVRNLPERPFSVIAGELIFGQLLDFSPTDVQRITTYAGGETRIIEAEGNSWFSDTELGRGLVFDVNVFLRDLHALSGSSIAATAEQNAWEQLGLAPVGETLRIELEMKDGSVHTLDVGGTTADGRRYYVRSSDRPHAYIAVEFLAINLQRKFEQATTDVLSVNLARVENVKAISVNSQGTSVQREFVRDKDQKLLWMSERRVAFYVASLLETVNGVTAFQLAPELSAATYGFSPNPNALSLQLTMENKAVHTLDIGNKTADGKYTYVKTSMRPGVYLASVAATDAIRAGLGVIRTELLPFDTTKVAELEIASVAKGQTEPVVHLLTNANGQWTRSGVTVDTARVENLVKLLRAMQAETIPPLVSEDQYKFYPAPESTRVSIRTTDGKELIFDIGAAVQQGTGWFTTTSYYGQVNDLDEIVFLNDRSTKDVRTAINQVTQ